MQRNRASHSARATRRGIRRLRGGVEFFACLACAAILAACSKSAEKKSVDPGEVDDEPLEAVDPNPEPAELAEKIEPEPEPEEGVDESSLVSFVGYHDFTQTRTPTEMRIREDKFRAQMQALKDASVPVISFDDFLAWRRGETDLPPHSVVITIDDGWEEVHTYAMPILKEFGYPFTLYLYTAFLDAGGRTLSQQQVEELIASGATLGSHSISHRDMNQVKVGRESMSYGSFERLQVAYSKALEELDAGAESATVNGARRSRAEVEAKLLELGEALAAYDEWITKELVESKEILERKFRVPIKTFAYPYGPYNDRLVKLAHDAGYDAMITVNGAKANFETPLGEVPRFIIHGADDRNWNMATSFRGTGSLADGNLLHPGVDADGQPKEILVRVSPADGELTDNRQPLLEFDFSRLPDVDPASLEMHVAGFGKVPATVDTERRVLSWKVRRKLRNETCSVTVTMRQGGERRRVGWQFNVDLLGLYTPEYHEKYGNQNDDSFVRRAEPVQG